jgi:hypothetical protein
MDHILANTDNPVPSADQQTSSTSNTEADEDDQEGLAAHIKKMGGTAGEELVANVGLMYAFKVREAKPRVEYQV